MEGLDPISAMGVYALIPSGIGDKPSEVRWERDALRLEPALGRRSEDCELGRGGRWEEENAEDNLGEDAVFRLEWRREGRGRPRERREGVEDAIIIDWIALFASTLLRSGNRPASADESVPTRLRAWNRAHTLMIDSFRLFERATERRSVGSRNSVYQQC